MGESPRTSTDIEAKAGPPTEIIVMPPPRRGPRIVSGVVGALGLVALFVLMSVPFRVPHGALLGALFTAVGTLGVVGALGELSGRQRVFVPLGHTWLGRLESESIFATPAFTFPLSLGLLVAGAAVFGYDGLPYTLTAALLALAPSALRRPGLALLVIASLIYLPLLGVPALWDPWETHYGEVAREILSRNDWISLWWAQDGWFWSKPVLIFWADALSMSALGFDPRPDAHPVHIEWALRLPIYAMSMAALGSVFALIKRIFGGRAGLLAGLALASTPHFFLLAHQNITDMPLVACLTVSLCLLMLAFAEDPESEPVEYGVGRARVTGRTAVLLALLCLTLPQAVYLLSRNATVELSQGALRLHNDTFLHGSAGNAGVAGNAPLSEARPAVQWLLSEGGRVDLAQPAMQGLVLLLLVSVAVFFLRREQRTGGLLMAGFYLSCGLGLLGKGLPALALPGLIALLYLIGSKRFGSLTRGELHVGLGSLLVIAVGMPWYIAMFVRHGEPFFNRIVIHDHINRLAAGVHGDSGSIAYFLGQLGYALFPWVALAPAAVAGYFWYRRGAQGVPDPVRQNREETRVFLGLWAVAGFTLFSAMVTKFHHYIFPVVPPLAVLSALLLDRMWGDTAMRASRVRRGLGTLAGLLAGPVLALAVGAFMGDLRGVVPAEVPATEQLDWVMRNPAPLWAAAGLLSAAIGLFVAAFLLLRHTSSAERTAFAEPRRIGLSAGLVIGAAVAAFVARDLSWVTDVRPAGFERLAGLYIYNYTRPFPAYLDYRPILLGFGVSTTLVIALGAFRRLRPLMARAFLGVALAFALFGVNVYMTDLADHWSIRPLTERYYATRVGPEEPFVAWQMNWKGENFYTGNRVEVFASLDNRAIRTWIEEHKGTRTFFALERTRLPSFRSLVQPRTVHELTTERDNNKFVLVSVEL